ncbi:MAG TPA: hypothetical protein VE981_03630 [Planctomycetota bacterium]|nr:hypothetical protein [Planctomycetota bacterium]
MGDLEKAKRELRYAKSTADDRRWDQLEPKIAIIEEALKGVPEAEAAPVLAELNPMKEKMLNGIREEKAGRIESDVTRAVAYAADEIARNPSQGESYIARAATKLDSDDAKQSLAPEKMQRFRAQIAELKAKADAGLRQEKAGSIEREIRRGISAAADELNRGYKESPNLQKAAARLDSPEAREVLTADSVAKLQAEIAPLQAKSGGSPPPPPPPPKPAPAAASAGNEKAGPIEADVTRNLRNGAEEMLRNPSQGESYLERAVAKLDTDDAKQNLAPETMQRLRAQAADLQAKIDAAKRKEKAGSIEREVRRILDAVAEELKRGYTESPQLPKAIARVGSAEAHDVLAADTLAKLQAEIAALQAQFGGSAAPPPPKPAASTSTPPTEAPRPTPAATLAPVVNEQARRIEADLNRTLGYALDELSRNPMQSESQIARLTTKLESDDVKQNLPPETVERFRGQVADLRAKFEASRKAEKARVLEDFINRFLRNAESDIDHNLRSAEDMLQHAIERIKKDDVKELCTPESIARFRSEIARIDGVQAAARKQTAISRALPILKELEERVARPIFDGSKQEWQIMGDLESLKTRVRSSVSDLPKDDADVKGIEARVAAVETIIASATVKLGREQSHQRVVDVWEIERKAIEGWEAESGGEAGSPTYEMPKTSQVVRRLTWFQNDATLQQIAAEYKDDKEIQGLLGEARKIRETAIAKLHAAFNALLAFMEKQPRPSSRFDLEKPSHLAGRAGSDFEGTPHQEVNLQRAKALGDRWEKEIEADRKARQAKYDELTAQAAAAWPGILSRIKAEDEFDPLNSGSKGRTVLLKEIRNRIGWDFSGAYDFAIWVGETPVVGNYDKTVTAAVEAACEKTGLGIDDHTDWDAVIVVGGPGKIKQRFNLVVRDRNNLEIGKIEEWRPVDCVLCTVIALRAGPAAAGPKA